jgi:hypothetical protein
MRDFFEPFRHNDGISVSLSCISSHMEQEVVGSVSCRAVAEEFTHQREKPPEELVERHPTISVQTSGLLDPSGIHSS